MEERCFFRLCILLTKCCLFTSSFLEGEGSLSWWSERRWCREKRAPLGTTPHDQLTHSQKGREERTDWLQQTPSLLLTGRSNKCAAMHYARRETAGTTKYNLCDAGRETSWELAECMLRNKSVKCDGMESCSFRRDFLHPLFTVLKK